MTSSQELRIQQRMISLSGRLEDFRRPGSEGKFQHLLELLHEHDVLAQELYRLRARVPPSDPLRSRLEDMMAAVSQDLVALQEPQPDSAGYAGWRERYRKIWRDNVPLLLWTVSVFLGSSVIGWLVATRSPEQASLLIPDRLIEEILEKRSWFAHLEDSPVLWGLLIAWNNIWVSILCFMTSVLFGLGTLYILVLNGIHLGAILGFCYVHGFHRELTNFILGHGPLELSIVTASAFAGLLFGRVFYSRPWRGLIQRIPAAALDGLCVMYGIIPWLILAALIEVGLSPLAEIGLGLKLLVGSIAALCFWTWNFAR